MHIVDKPQNLLYNALNIKNPPPTMVQNSSRYAVAVEAAAKFWKIVVLRSKT